MTFKHNEIEIDQENPFKNCKLDREKYARILTNIIENYPKGFVLAINNKWGTGKSTFAKMWKHDLMKSGYKTIYFNAWENDFEDNPLTALIGELKTIDQKGEEKLNKVIKNAALITKNVAPALLKALLNKYVDSDIIVDALSDTSKSCIEIFEEDIKGYAARKKSIADFKKSLSEFVENESKGKPLIFIIDELDRCRPNYSVLLLEQIKHFFSVPNIVFVLSIDKTQLGNAICGVYGSEKIDTDEYLKRFIDIEYSIPKAEKGKFFDYLFEYFDFDAFFKSQERSRYRGFYRERDNFVFAGKILIGNLTLRQQEKILSHIRITLRTLNHSNYLIPTIFIFLVYIKTFYEKFYSELSNKTLSLNEVQNEFYEIVKRFLDDETIKLFVQTEAYLLTFYENDKLEFRGQSQILEWKPNESKYELKINSKIDDSLFYEQLSNEPLRHEFSDLKLSYFLSKLNLTENIKIN